MATDNTALDVIIPELWSDDVLGGLYSEPLVLNRVQRVDGDVKAYGDILHLPAMPTMSINDVTASTGAVTDQTVTLTEAQLTVNQWREITSQVIDKASIQAKIDVINAMKQNFQDGLGADIDNKLLALYSDVSQSVGDSNSSINEDILTAAIGTLMNNKLGAALRDPNRVSLCLHTAQWSAFKKVKEWNQAQITGEAVGGAMKMTVANAYGVPVYFSAEVSTSVSAYQNLLFVREAFALGIQRQIEFKELVSTGLAKRYCANVLYGVKTRAASRAVKVLTTTA